VLEHRARQAPRRLHARIEDQRLLRRVPAPLGDRLAGKVDHRVDATHRLGGHLARVIPGVACGRKRQPAPGGIGVAHQADQRVAACGEPLAQFTADEPGGAGQQDAHSSISVRALSNRPVHFYFAGAGLAWFRLASAAARRHAAGGIPTSRLKARANAASES